MVEKLEEVSPGVYRTTAPLPVYGNWKTTLRLHQGSAVQGLPVYFPEDKAIPVKGVPAEPSFTREFKRDKQLLQREQKSDVPGALVLLAYLTVLVIGIALYASMGWGLAVLQRRLGLPQCAREGGGSVGLGRAVPPHACHSLSTGKALARSVVISPVRKTSSSRNVYWKAAVTRGSSYHLTSRRWSCLQALRSAGAVVRLSSPACGAPTPVSVIHTTCFLVHLCVAAPLAASSTGLMPVM